MSVLLTFGAGLVVMLALLGAVLALLLGPLSASLQELCGAKERGDFWTALSGVALAVGTLFLGLLGFWYGQFNLAGAQANETWPVTAEFWSLVLMVQWATAGVMLGLVAISAIVLSFTARLDRGVLPVPAATPER